MGGWVHGVHAYKRWHGRRGMYGSGGFGNSDRFLKNTLYTQTENARVL